MCCLFGMMDLECRFTGKQRAKILRILAHASEARGTDATGIAYNSGGKLHIFKRPYPPIGCGSISRRMRLWSWATPV